MRSGCSRIRASTSRASSTRGAPHRATSTTSAFRPTTPASSPSSRRARSRLDMALLDEGETTCWSLCTQREALGHRPAGHRRAASSRRSATSRCSTRPRRAILAAPPAAAPACGASAPTARPGGHREGRVLPPRPPAGCGGAGHGAAAGGGRRLRRHGRAPGASNAGAGIARQHAGDGGGLTGAIELSCR